ncbi:AppA family phytase/histidine-type acid phosphatase [Pandoraea aquatica]|uniref:AppA family phytase/histidine-type acid phosphatase n=1 Tax=Pandoraea aquatica TaxID=2508290 RepID=A0A5E4UC68_9BURK|nr:histidine-type phosphatase [Pandoraea aquatica]VVD96424.1 AppA family phytase/histidine-type acid phosphatase [Pandoraea aquatica]
MTDAMTRVMTREPVQHIEVPSDRSRDRAPVQRWQTCLAALAVVSALSACTTPPMQQPGPAKPPESAARIDGMPADWTLVSTVIVSRHGVRSPTHAHPPLDKLSPDAWPGWPVPAGYLTARGGSLSERMGRYYGDWLRARRVLPENTCPAPGSVYGWADIDQRTRESGNALLQGIAPGCDMRTSHQTDLTTYDAVFQPVAAGDCPLDPGAARGAIESRLAPEGVSGLNKRYAATLTRMGEVLDYAHSPACGAPGGCKLEDVPTRLRVEGDGSGVALRGALGSAAKASEVFLLQAGEGLPDNQVAWGRIRDDKDWALLLEAHNAQRDLLNKTPYLAATNGTPLLATVLDALARAETTSASSTSPVRGPALPAGNRVYVLTGHDTNIANLAGMLKLDWRLPDQPDNTPPDGAIVFTLWRNPAGEPFVRAEFVYQSMHQLRHLTALSLDEPAKRETLAIPDCDDGPDGKACKWPTFSQRVKAALSPACLQSVR